MKDSITQEVWRPLRWVLLILVILSHLGFTQEHSSINPDELYQLGVSHSFMRGHNQALKYMKADDISQGEYIGNLRTPPGYALVQIASRGDFSQSCWIDLVMDSLGGVIFFVSWFFILEAMGPFIGVLPRLAVWLYLLVFPAALMGPLLTCHTTGALSVAFFSAAVALTLPVMQHEASWRKVGVLGVLSGVCFGVALVMRYAYWPLIAAIPLSLGLFGLRYRQKLRKAVSTAVAFCLTSGSILMVLLLHNYQISGSFTRSNPAPSDIIRLGHLLYTIPFPAFALGCMDDSYSSAVQSLHFDPALLLSICILVLGTYGFYRLLRTQASDAADTTEQSARAVFQYISLLAVVTLVLVYAFLASISISSNVHPYRGGWVAVAEIRYYAPVYMFLLLAVALIFARRPQTAIRCHYAIACAAGLILLTCWIPRLAARVNDLRMLIVAPKKISTSPLIHHLSEMASGTPGQDIVLFDNSSRFLYSTGLSVGLDAVLVSKESGFATSEPVVVIFYAGGDNSEWYFDYVNGEPLRKMPFRSGYIYQYVLNPATG